MSLSGNREYARFRAHQLSVQPYMYPRSHRKVKCTLSTRHLQLGHAVRDACFHRYGRMALVYFMAGDANGCKTTSPKRKVLDRSDMPRPIMILDLFLRIAAFHCEGWQTVAISSHRSRKARRTSLDNGAAYAGDIVAAWRQRYPCTTDDGALGCCHGSIADG